MRPCQQQSGRRNALQRAGRRRSGRGAVLIEFLVVFMPLVFLFVGIWQVCELYAAQLVLARASSAAGRAASVVLPDNPEFYSGVAEDDFDGERKAEVTLAAGLILAASPHFTKDFAVTLSQVPQREFGVIDVTVKAHLDCHGLRMLCPFAETMSMSSTSSHAYHGAAYDPEPLSQSVFGGNTTTATSDCGRGAGGSTGSGNANGGATQGAGGAENSVGGKTSGAGGAKNSSGGNDGRGGASNGSGGTNQRGHGGASNGGSSSAAGGSTQRGLGGSAGGPDSGACTLPPPAGPLASHTNLVRAILARAAENQDSTSCSRGSGGSGGGGASGGEATGGEGSSGGNAGSGGSGGAPEQPCGNGRKWNPSTGRCEFQKSTLCPPDMSFKTTVGDGPGNCCRDAFDEASCTCAAQTNLKGQQLTGSYIPNKSGFGKVDVDFMALGTSCANDMCTVEGNEVAKTDDWGEYLKDAYRIDQWKSLCDGGKAGTSTSTYKEMLKAVKADKAETTKVQNFGAKLNAYCTLLAGKSSDALTKQGVHLQNDPDVVAAEHDLLATFKALDQKKIEKGVEKLGQSTNGFHTEVKVINTLQDLETRQLTDLTNGGILDVTGTQSPCSKCDKDLQAIADVLGIETKYCFKSAFAQSPLTTDAKEVFLANGSRSSFLGKNVAVEGCVTYSKGQKPKYTLAAGQDKLCNPPR